MEKDRQRSFVVTVSGKAFTFDTLTEAVDFAETVYDHADVWEDVRIWFRPKETKHEEENY